MVSSKMHTLTGTVTVSPPLDQIPLDYIKKFNAVHDGSAVDCSPGMGSGYADLRTGTSVTVSNESSTTIATGSLGQGKFVNLGCVFQFKLDVPKAKFYKVEVANRGETQKSFDDMVAQDWKLELSIGEE